jgi:hypothetical protein
MNIVYIPNSMYEPQLISLKLALSILLYIHCYSLFIIDYSLCLVTIVYLFSLTIH